jgi:hypothetical protein
MKQIVAEVQAWKRISDQNYCTAAQPSAIAAVAQYSGTRTHYMIGDHAACVRASYEPNDAVRLPTALSSLCCCYVQGICAYVQHTSSTCSSLASAGWYRIM